MVKPITAHQLNILQFVGKHPGVEKELLISQAKATLEDLKYLEEHDMIREREAGRYRIAHFGEMVLRRT
jgi:predicted transcriptional regulator